MKFIPKIDIHAHVTLYPDIVPANPYSGRPTLGDEGLLRMYDELGIGTGVLLPMITMAGGTVITTNEETMTIAERNPGRFVWFCNVDPRALDNTPHANLSYLLEHYKKLGARGVGEIMTNLYFDDPRTDNLFSHCEECDMPVLFHMSPATEYNYGLADDAGMPRLEKMLKKHPRLKIIGHSQPFWAEISAWDKDVCALTLEDRNRYPTGKVKEGALPRLLREYENLYCDLSAGSGCNAMTRDPEYAVSFMTEFEDRILYGCDICADTNQHPYRFRDFFDGLRESGAISETVYYKIARGNAEKLLKLV